MSEAAVALFVVFDPPRIEQILKPAYRQALFPAVVQESLLRARSDSVFPVEYAPAQSAAPRTTPETADWLTPVGYHT
jgi:hypothetical protein